MMVPRSFVESHSHCRIINLCCQTRAKAQTHRNLLTIATPKLKPKTLQTMRLHRRSALTTIVMTFSHASAWSALPLQAVLLDLDGTLIDTLDEFDAALAAMSQSLALPRIERSVIAHTIGKGSEHLVRTVLAQLLQQAQRQHDAAAVETLFDSAMAAYFTGYEAIGMDHVKVYAGVTQGLQILRSKGYAMGVVTNKPERLAKPLLKATGLAQFTEFLIAGDTYAKKKPDPFPLLQGCAKLQSSPQHTLMIGDSANDAAAARAAQCPVAILRYGFNHGLPVETIDADGYFDSIEEIASALGVARPATSLPFN